MSYYNTSNSRSKTNQTNQRTKQQQQQPYSPPSKRNTPSTPSYSSNKKNLNNMLRDYQKFCQRYFGNTTPIAAMPQEQFEKIFNYNEIEEETKVPEVHGFDVNSERIKNVSLDFLENDKYDFYYAFVNTKKELAKLVNGNELIQLSTNQVIGFGKNNKIDYLKRLRRINMKHSNNSGSHNNNNNNKQKTKETNEHEDKKQTVTNNKDDDDDDDDNYKEEFQYEEKEEVDDNANDSNVNNNKKGKDVKKESIKIFDESTHKIINDENRNQQATKIQIYFKGQKHTKRLKDRMYFGYDKSKKNIVWVYVDKREPKFEKKNCDVFSLLFKVYSIENKVVSYLKKNVKDVIGVEKKKRNEIEKEINDIIEKVLKQDEKDKDEEEEMYRSFEELHSEKGELNRNIQQSISSIDNIDYDNI